MRELFKLLTFRISQQALGQLGRRHLALGIAATWVVGVGRWWDDPKAEWVQQTGIGSLVYVVVLALILWLVVLPLRPRGWSYRHVLTFVTLTAPPALLYAIPVERFLSVKLAAQINLWFLLAVAVWRVALLFFYLCRHAGIRWWGALVASLLPLTAIVATLAILNLSRGVVAIMGGIRDMGADHLANEVVTLLGLMSYATFVPVLIAYLVLIVIRRRTGA